jgi:hypothetical protein
MARWIVGCESSGRVREELRKLGHDAWSCDIKPAEDNSPHHFQEDILEVLRIERFDGGIFHPVCKYLANSGVQHLHTEPGRWEKMRKAAAFFNALNRCERIPVRVTENPIPHKYAKELIGDYTQIIQPYHHGDKQMKATCLWINGTDKRVVRTNDVGPPPKDPEERKKWQDVWRCPPGPQRETERSRTFPGIARALAITFG